MVFRQMAAKILVVEDETPVRDMICFALSKADYDCFGAKDARHEGLKMVTEEVVAESR